MSPNKKSRGTYCLQGFGGEHRQDSNPPTYRQLLVCQAFGIGLSVEIDQEKQVNLFVHDDCRGHSPVKTGAFPTVIRPDWAAFFRV